MTRARRCRHEVVQQWWRWFGKWIDHRPRLSDSPPDAESCLDCGHWLSLGPSNDTGCEVEIRAARIASTLKATEVPRMSRCEQHGWEAHANGLTLVLCKPSAFNAGYLARIIAAGEGE
jgi:hypothetical protein